MATVQIKQKPQRLAAALKILGTYCGLSMIYERKEFRRRIAELRDWSYELCRMQISLKRKVEGKPPLPLDVSLNPPEYLELDRMHDVMVVDIRVEQDNSFHFIMQPWKMRYYLRFSFLEIIQDDSKPGKFEGKVSGKVDVEASSLGRDALVLKHAMYSSENLAEEPVMISPVKTPKWKLHWKLWTIPESFTFW